MKYGPETPTIDAFIRHLKGMTPEQWAATPTARGAAFYAALDAALDAAGYTARDAAWYAAWDAVREAARDAAAVYATYEILGASLMRERNQPFYFLPMFGFDSPEAILENDQ